MAVTYDGARLTVQHRAEQLAIRARSVQGLLDLWRTVDPANLTGTIDIFVQAAVMLANQGFRESAAAAAAYFESFRRAEDVTRAAAAVIATPPRSPLLANVLRGAALRGIISGRRRGMTLEDAGANGFAKVAGSLIKQVLAGGRMTILGSVQKDPVALGWTRVTSGDPCAFCRMLAGRGAVYKSRKTAEFESHGDCACTPEAVYPGDPLDIGPRAQAETYQAEYRTAQDWARSSGTMSRGTSNDALNNYRRWLANGSPEPGTPAGGL